MKKKLIIGLLACALLLSRLTTLVLASGCIPACEGCQNCEEGVCVDRDYLCNPCHYCYMGTCMPYGDCGGGCPACESCVSCWCQCTSECCQGSDCTGECHNGCSGCSCVDDNSQCSTLMNCEECNNGNCEDRCPALGKYCNGSGDCVVCTTDAHCNDICKHCTGGECKHNCAFCTTPRYCAYACYCTDCSTEEDYDLCSESQEEYYQCPGCTYDVVVPCTTFFRRDYTGNPEITCTTTHMDCSHDDHLCWTEYKCTTGFIIPFYICAVNENGPMGLACESEGSNTFVCTQCKQDPDDEGDPWYADNNTCPTEQWP